MVTFIIYAARLDLFTQEILHIKSLLGSHDTDLLILNNKNKLVSLIPGLCKNKTAAILFAASKEELEGLVGIKEQFGAIPTVLILPDGNTETFQKGMLLQPFYFMAKQDHIRQFSLAINELCQIYKDYFNKPASSLL